MARFFFIREAVVAFIIACEICVIVASMPETTSQNVPSPVEAYDFWECVQYAIPYGQKNCVEIRDYAVRLRKPNATRCGWKIPRFCNETIDAEVAREISLNTEKVTLKTIDDYMPPDYVLYPGVGYYKIHTANTTWAQAKHICVAEGVNTHLAIPSTPEEYAAIYNLSRAVLPHHIYGFYIGITDRAVEGEYRTIFGQPLCTLQQALWIEGEPNNYFSNEDCIAIGYDKVDKFIDYPCDTKLPFVCEKSLPGQLKFCES